MTRPAPLVDLVNAISAAWVALEPPAGENDYARKAYVRIEKEDSGAAGHREFYFKPPTGQKVTLQGRSQHMITHNFDAVIHLHVPERKSTLFEAVYQEYQGLSAAVWTLNPIPSRVIAPMVLSYRWEQPTADEGDIQLILALQARTQEINT